MMWHSEEDKFTPWDWCKIVVYAILLGTFVVFLFIG